MVVTDKVDATKTVAKDLKTRIIEQVIFMKTLDEDYARYALAQYHAAMPWLNLNKAVGIALAEMKGQK